MLTDHVEWFDSPSFEKESVESDVVEDIIGDVQVQNGSRMKRIGEELGEIWAKVVLWENDDVADREDDCG